MCVPIRQFPRLVEARKHMEETLNTISSESALANLPIFGFDYLDKSASKRYIVGG